MAEIKWIKVATDVFDNRKIRQIECLPEGDGIIVIWFKLLCLAGNINDSGMIYFTKEMPYTEQMMATQFNRPLPLVQLALRTFEQFGMIEIVNDILCVSNWEKYQNVDGLEKIREQTRKRVAKYRQNQKQLADSVTGNVTVTECNAIDKDIDKDIDKNKRFVKPSLEEVQAYCQERSSTVDGQRFIDYYDSVGWKVGKKPMKDWKACVRTWERNQNKESNIDNSKTDLDDIF